MNGILGKTMVIACDVLKEQINSLGEVPYTIIYLEQLLHRTPKTLKEQLQDLIDENPDYDTFLFGYGMCSRSVIGLQTKPQQKMIIPKIDDCIGITMGARDKYYQEFEKNPGTFYFTKCWIDTAQDPLKEYHRTVLKYGEEVADWTIRECMKNYKRAVLINDMDRPHEASREYVENFADFFNLNYDEVAGSSAYVRKLFFGPWDEDFVVVEGGIMSTDEMFNSRTLTPVTGR